MTHSSKEDIIHKSLPADVLDKLKTSVGQYAVFKSRTKEQQVKLVAKAEEFLGQRFTHPDKVLFPTLHATKLDLAEYYMSMAQYIMPFACDRPVSFVRGVRGVEDKRFFQRHPPSGLPSAMNVMQIKEKTSKESKEYMVIGSDSRAFIAGVQMDTLEFQAWLSTRDHLQTPDKLVFNLDPVDLSWKKVIQVTFSLKKVLEEGLRLRSFCMVTGGTGVHVICPLKEAHHSYDTTHEVARAVAMCVASIHENVATTNPKEERKGKVFVDYIRNSFAQTLILPYSTRAIRGAFVATPLSWSEFEDSTGSQMFDIKTIQDRMERLKQDPWQGFYSSAQTIPDEWAELTQQYLKTF